MWCHAVLSESHRFVSGTAEGVQSLERGDLRKVRAVAGKVGLMRSPSPLSAASHNAASANELKAAIRNTFFQVKRVKGHWLLQMSVAFFLGGAP